MSSNFFHYAPDDIKFNTMFQLIPMWLAVLLGVVWLFVVIYKSGKFKLIKEDFRNPMFYATLGMTLVLMFMTKDDNPIRSQEANKHALLTAIAAYFGHLDIWFAAFIMGGALIYYTWDAKQVRSLEVNWGMDPDMPVMKTKQHYIGQGWNKEKEVI